MFWTLEFPSKTGFIVLTVWGPELATLRVRMLKGKKSEKDEERKKKRNKR
jgi:hypothetical protein